MTEIADPTGARFTIRSGDAIAEITQVGAALRAFRTGEIDIVPRYPDTLPTPAASGIILVPWPNRVRDGHWSQRGTDYQLSISEPAHGNASHGLLRYTAYQPIAGTADSVTLAAHVYPQTGYPFHLATEVTYTLFGSALLVTHRIRNVGAQEAPVAVGAHPYLQIGDVPTAELTLQLDAARRILTDARQLPVGEDAVDAATDLRRPRAIGELHLDTAYTDIACTADDEVEAILAAPDGRRIRLWAGIDYRYLQVFTTDRYPGQPLAVAIEPMTAPADAFNSGEGLRWLAPGEEWTPSWGIDAGGLV